MSSTARQNNLLLAEDWQKVYQSFRNADFQSYDFENLRRTMIDYLRINYPEDFNDYIESSEYLALIDLIAYIGQSIAFRVDLNARENFLELAERRESVLRLARLISYNAKRNVAATGLLKFNTIQTTENVIDSNGRNIAGQYITWNDPSNNNWYDQFIKIINAALPSTQQFGNPVDQAAIYGVPTAQYRFNGANKDVPVYNFTKTVAGRSMDFEITSTTFNGKTVIYEEAPKIGNSIACVYTDDGYGAGSPGTGFFFNFTQGTLNQGTFTINQPNNNETVDIDSQNINNTDVWLYGLDENSVESKTWTQVPALTGNNIIYNSLSGKIRDIYAVVTRNNDAVSLSFSDGTFGNLPLGAFRVYYRISNGLSYTINPSDITNVMISIPYVSVQGQTETLSVSLSLASSVTNSSTSETNASVKTNAPQAYYTQNRMITGEDYNISPLTASQQVAKVKAVNRSSSGISRYFDLTDPTGKYSSTNLFADDGVLYQQVYSASTTFSYVTRTDIQGVVHNLIYDILNSADLRNFYYANFVDFLSSSLNIAWYNVTVEGNSSSGFVGNITDSSNPYVVGPTTTTDLKYITPGALLKIVAPSGYYFDTLHQNKLIAGTASVKGAASTIWAEIMSVNGDGTAAGTGVLTSGIGPIVLNKPIQTTTDAVGTVIAPIVTQVIPQFTTTINSTVVTTMIDLIFSNVPFGLRYEPAIQQWQIVFESNLDTTSNFSLGNQGSITNTKQDASWMLLFTTNNEYYTVVSRQMRYVFESDKELTFYFDNNLKIYDSVTSKIINDEIKVLSINTKPPLYTTPYTQDLVWEIVSEYIGKDGYIDPKKVVVSFADSDNNGIVDDPELFLNIVAPDAETTYIVTQRYSIAEGQEDYKYVPNDAVTGPVIIKPTKTANFTKTAGQYFYFVDTGLVMQVNSVGILTPSLDYRVYIGRDKLKFQYTHSADYDSRIDPGASNLMDIYVLTNSYDTQFRQWLQGANVSKPLPPSSSELHSMLAPSLNLIKSISDEVIYHPVSYKLLFGADAEASLQATFNVIMNPNSAVSTADVTARILAAINKFFGLSNWDFGDTFYFTELSTYVMNQLAPDITNFVIVPKQSGQYFGSLFEIKCPSNQIFLSSATANDIIVVAGLTSANLKTVTGTGLNSVAVTQQITSANYGASN
jgi:hypothetical protein